VLAEAVRPENGGTRDYWITHPDVPVRILAICHQRGGDLGLIRAVFNAFGGNTWVNLDEPAFRQLLRQEFENLGLALPEELFG